jgi:hypothetical protein
VRLLLYSVFTEVPQLWGFYEDSCPCLSVRPRRGRLSLIQDKIFRPRFGLPDVAVMAAPVKSLYMPANFIQLAAARSRAASAGTLLKEAWKV